MRTSGQGVVPLKAAVLYGYGHGVVRVPAQDLPLAIVRSLGGYPRSSTGVGTVVELAGVNWAGYQTGLTASPFRGRSFRSV